jgi:hypothetical protein
MGFEQTVSEYVAARGDLVGGSAEEKEFIRAMALQKAWSDRMCEIPNALDKEEREDLAVNTVFELGEWFRKQIMEFPAENGQVSRKQHYLDLFDQDPNQAVQELYELYRKGLH